MIPSKIHYVWFGSEKPPKVIECINSWTKKMPGYEIVEWNENNSPIDHPFVSYCLANKQWAYASDYVRLWVLFQHGGVYLDTDMEVCSDFTPLMNNKKFMIAYESEKLINAGIIASEPGNEIIGRLLAVYDSLVLVEPIPNLLTKLFSLHNNWFCDADIYIGTPAQFYPLDYHSKEMTTSEYYTIHHWHASWMEAFPKFQLSFLYWQIGYGLNSNESKWPDSYGCFKNKLSAMIASIKSDDYKLIYKGQVDNVLRQYIIDKHILKSKYSIKSFLKIIGDIGTDYFVRIPFSQQILLPLKSVIGYKSNYGKS